MNGANQDEVIYWIDPTNGDIWERTGYCSQCGDCCEEEGNGFAVIDGNGEENHVPKVVEGKCAYFRWGNDGKCYCAGADTRYYNNGCRFIPTKPGHIATWPNCTYKFTKIN